MAVKGIGVVIVTGVVMISLVFMCQEDMGK